jgi:hypothetical protein
MNNRDTIVKLEKELFNLHPKSRGLYELILGLKADDQIRSNIQSNFLNKENAGSNHKINMFKS